MDDQQRDGHGRQFPIQEWAIFCKTKNIKELHGGVPRVRGTSDPADLVSLWLIDAEIAEKGQLWMETSSFEILNHLSGG